MIKHRILCVDDEESILNSLKRLLLHEPYIVDLVSSGKDALEMLEMHTYALLVTDQRMPQMSGLQLVERFKAKSPATVRIMLSGDADLQDVSNALENNTISLFLKKPWDPENLKGVILEGLEHYENDRRMFTLLEHIDLNSARKFMQQSWLVEDLNPYDGLLQISWSMSQSPLPILIINESFETLFVNQALRILFPSLTAIHNVSCVRSLLLDKLVTQLKKFFASDLDESEIPIFSGDVLVQKLHHYDAEKLYVLYYLAKMPTDESPQQHQ